MVRSAVALCLLTSSLLAACGDDLPGEGTRVIVFTRQTVWMHASNPLAGAALVELGTARGWQIEQSDDPAIFTPERLATTDAVVFAVTSGDILDAPAREALEPFFARGGGFVGIHSASYTEMSWPFYRASLVPVTFRTHPYPTNVLPGVLTHESSDPIIDALPDPWPYEDEFYSFHERPEELGVKLLLALDETTMGPEFLDECKVGYHPLAFTHERSGGRTFYSALGHTEASYSDPAFLGMIERGIAWAAAGGYRVRTGQWPGDVTDSR